MYECLMNLAPSLLEPPHTRARLSAQAEVLIGMHKRDDEIPSRAHTSSSARTHAERSEPSGGGVEVVLVKLLSARAPLTPKPLFKDYPEGGEVEGVVSTKTAGSACQNTSMSTNWVIFDMRTACQRIDGGVIGEPSACEAALARDQSLCERRLQTIWHGPGTARHKSI
ncbi:hypothetical protein QQF64_010307 [Cirrhinus molitorella]|uniref:Uncharacterized protein n=1 Tax=Cirrhinus molitorella TaxID=172907 RepID=A0ABR3M3N2_9TELE